MIREILTLEVDSIPTQYYINFQKDRKNFNFRPTLKHKTAPAFSIRVQDDQLFCDDPVHIHLIDQAREKVREILGSNLFDRF